MELADWIEGYRRAWEENDAELLLTLFTEDASYRSSPFREPSLGHEGIRRRRRRHASRLPAAPVRAGRALLRPARVLERARRPRRSARGLGQLEAWVG